MQYHRHYGIHDANKSREPAEIICYANPLAVTFRIEYYNDVLIVKTITSF